MKTSERTDVAIINTNADAVKQLPDMVQPHSPQLRKILLATGGFTLVELLVVIIIIGILATIAMQSWPTMNNMAKRARALSEINMLSTAISAFQADRGSLPPDLRDVGFPALKDPWGHLYVYQLVPWRKDGALELLNTDYDLYSPGVDGATAQKITDAPDDIVRAANGGFIGVAVDY